MIYGIYKHVTRAIEDGRAADARQAQLEQWKRNGCSHCNGTGQKDVYGGGQLFGPCPVCLGEGIRSSSR